MRATRLGRGGEEESDKPSPVKKSLLVYTGVFCKCSCLEQIECLSAVALRKRERDYWPGLELRIMKKRAVPGKLIKDSR